MANVAHIIYRKWLLLASQWLNVLSFKEYNVNYFTENSCGILGTSGFIQHSNIHL